LSETLAKQRKRILAKNKSIRRRSQDVQGYELIATLKSLDK
jgi:hypothetical protein